MNYRGAKLAASMSRVTDQDACAFVDSIIGDSTEWSSPLLVYRLTSDFQSDWKAEVGRWLLFAHQNNFLPKVKHRLVERAKRSKGDLLPNGKINPNDTGHLIFCQEVAPVQVAYYLADSGWRIQEWEPAVSTGDVDIRMMTPSGELCDIQVKASDNPGRIVGYRIASGENDTHVLLGIEKAISQLKDSSGPKRLVVATPQRTWPMSRDASEIAVHVIGSTVGSQGGKVTLESEARGIFANTGKHISAVMVLDLIRSQDTFYGGTVFLNSWAVENANLTPSVFPEAAVCELVNNKFIWHGHRGLCHVLPHGTQYNP